MPRVLQPKDLPNDAKVKRTVLHWTGGKTVPNSIDTKHYHFLVAEAKNKPATPYIVRGAHGLSAVNPPLKAGQYAAHTRHLNSNSASVSICGMLGAVRPSYAGPEPFSKEQWQMAVDAVADIHEHYDVFPTKETCLMHSTVELVLGIDQLGKWDVDLLPWDPKMKPAQVHEFYLDAVRDALEPVDREQFRIVYAGRTVGTGFYLNSQAQVPLRAMSEALGFKILKAGGGKATIAKGLSFSTLSLHLHEGSGYSPLKELLKALNLGGEYIDSQSLYRIVSL